jgi:hypothetical protein
MKKPACALARLVRIAFVVVFSLVALLVMLVLTLASPMFLVMDC